MISPGASLCLGVAGAGPGSPAVGCVQGCLYGSVEGPDRYLPVASTGAGGSPLPLASVFHERGWRADDGEVGSFWGGHASW
jgi:hypothetical protein